MPNSKNTIKPEADHSDSRRGRYASAYFWATILTLVVTVIGLTIVGQLKLGTESHDIQERIEIAPTILEKVLSEATEKARAAALNQLNVELEHVYEPAFSKISEYTDFHYSVLGQYTELWETARGELVAALEERLLRGFGERLHSATSTLDKAFLNEFRRNLPDMGAGKSGPEDNPSIFGELTQTVLQDAKDRVAYTYPVATVSAVAVGSGSLKIVATTIGKKIALKISATAAAKGILKGGGVLTGAGSGALICSWSGPGAAVCGVVGGAVAWLLADAVIVNIDEYFNSDDFEAEIRAILLEDMAEKRAVLESAITQKAIQVEKGNTKTLREVLNAEKN